MATTRVRTCGLLAWLMLAAAVPANAGDVWLSMHDGRVTLVARDVMVRDVLAAWEIVGRTKVIARERVPGTLTTLDIVDQPEAAALATVLRGVVGFVAARHHVLPKDASIYRLIVVNPTPAGVFVPQSAPAAPQMAESAAMGPRRGELGNFPPAFVPPPADDASGGLAVSPGRIPGMLQPGPSGLGGPARPPFDGSGGIDPAARPSAPAQTPGYPGAGNKTPGGLTPVIKPPGGPGELR